MPSFVPFSCGRGVGHFIYMLFTSVPLLINSNRVPWFPKAPNMNRNIPGSKCGQREVACQIPISLSPHFLLSSFCCQLSNKAYICIPLRDVNYGSLKGARYSSDPSEESSAITTSHCSFLF